MWTADDEEGSFVSEDGSQRNLAQGWKVNVGFDNFVRVFTNDTIRESFLRILVWNFAFAIGTVVITFALGLLVALALNNPLMRGRTLYRSLIILPYAMPSIAMYLVWREMFNKDFGLINRILGTDINWFGSTASSMFADPARSSCGSATTTCSWSSPARSSRSPPTSSRRPGSTAPSRSTPSGPSRSRCCSWRWPRC